MPPAICRCGVSRSSKSAASVLTFAVRTGSCYLATPSWSAPVPVLEMGSLCVSLQSTPHLALEWTHDTGLLQLGHVEGMEQLDATSPVPCVSWLMVKDWALGGQGRPGRAISFASAFPGSLSQAPSCWKVWVRDAGLLGGRELPWPPPGAAGHCGSAGLAVPVTRHVLGGGRSTLHAFCGDQPPGPR